MEIKKYYTANMAEAMERIRRELGPDAVILSDRKVRKKGLRGFFSPRVTEVVVAYEKGDDKLRKIAEQSQPDIQQRMDNLRQVLEAVDKRAAMASAKNEGKIYKQGEAPVPDKSTRVQPPPSPVPEPSGEDVSPEKQQKKLEEEIARRVLSGEKKDPSFEPFAPRQVEFSAEASGDDTATYRRPAPLPPRPEGKEKPAADARPAKKPPVPSPEEEKVQLAELLRSELAAMRDSQMEELHRLEQRILEEARKEQVDSESVERLATRLTSLQNTVDALTERVGALPIVKPRFYETNAQAYFEKLIESDVYEDVAHALIQEAEKIASNMDGDFREALELLLVEKMGGVSVPLQPQKNKPCVVILFGPTGVGKTTTLVKLAAHYALHENKKVALINSDTYRIAAQEQLDTYADIISAPTRVVYSTTEIVDAMREFSDRDMIFIDTAGKKPTDQAHKDEIARLVELTGATEQLLVLSAPSSYKSLQQIIDNYSFLKEYKLLITKTDEVKGLGSVLSSAVYAGRPLSYTTCGQNVPDDIAEADIPGIARSLLE